MPFELRLTRTLKNQGWKVKIRDKERLEPPHVTVMFRTKEWRIDLRSSVCMVPPGGRWKDIDVGVKEILERNWELLKSEWDRMYPSNPITSDEEDE